MSNQTTRAKRASDTTNSSSERLLPQRLQVARPVEDEDDVVPALPEDLVGELDLPATRVLGARRHLL